MNEQAIPATHPPIVIAEIHEVGNSLVDNMNMKITILPVQKMELCRLN